MKLKAFEKTCDAVILVDKLPDNSNLKQMIAGVVEAFGLCSNGTVVALNDVGKVVCPKAEATDKGCFCEDDLSPCDLEAVKTAELMGLIQLIKDFPIENFLTKEGIPPKRAASAKTAGTEPGQAKKSKQVSTEKYDDEDFGISPFLPKEVADKRRAELRKK